MSPRALLLAAVLGAAAALAASCHPARRAPAVPPPPAASGPAAVPSDPAVAEARRLEEDLERPALPEPAAAAEVLFAPGAAALTAEARAALDRLVDELQGAAADVFLEVQGHSDATGGERDNWELARRRAEAVRDYLLREKGIPEDSVGVLPLGPALPAADNRTAAGRARNRRVVVLALLPPPG